MLQHFATALLALNLAFAHFAHAQAELEDSDAAPSAEKDVEDLYDKEDDKVVKPKAQQPKTENQPEAQNLSDLANLASFSDVAVIQRRFLPKSQRFEATAGAFTNLNNRFLTRWV